MDLLDGSGVAVAIAEHRASRSVQQKTGISPAVQLPLNVDPIDLR